MMKVKKYLHHSINILKNILIVKLKKLTERKQLTEMKSSPNQKQKWLKKWFLEKQFIDINFIKTLFFYEQTFTETIFHLYTSKEKIEQDTIIWYENQVPENQYSFKQWQDKTYGIEMVFVLLIRMETLQKMY